MSWYREEFVCGTHATDPAFRGGKSIRDFYPAVEACLLGLVATDTIQELDAASHFARLSDSSFRERWLESGQSAEHVDEIASYMDALRDWLVGQPQAGQLKLVPVHGDFSLVNAIATDDGLRFIDWEGIAPGCVYDDIFNFNACVSGFTLKAGQAAVSGSQKASELMVLPVALRSVALRSRVDRARPHQRA